MAMFRHYITLLSIKTKDTITFVSICTKIWFLICAKAELVDSDSET
jgi:hypothetical protein